MTKKAKNLNIDLNAVDDLLENVPQSTDSKSFDKPATRWLNLDFVLKSKSDPSKIKKVPLPFGVILDSLESRLAEGLEPNSSKPLSKAEAKKYEDAIKVLDMAFAKISAGSSMEIPVIARLSKPSSVEDDVQEVDDFEF